MSSMAELLETSDIRSKLYTDEQNLESFYMLYLTMRMSPSMAISKNGRNMNVVRS